MSKLEEIKERWAWRASPSGADVAWLVAEVERLTAAYERECNQCGCKP